MAKLSKMAALMEEVHSMVTDMDRSNQGEMISAYANAAIVSDSLSTRYLDMAEMVAAYIEEGDQSEFDGNEAEVLEGLVEMAEYYQSVAEEAADSAEALNEAVQMNVFAESVNVDNVEVHFKNIMSSILEGCDMYGELSSQMNEGEGDDGDEGVEDAEVEAAAGNG